LENTVGKLGRIWITKAGAVALVNSHSKLCEILSECSGPVSVVQVLCWLGVEFDPGVQRVAVCCRKAGSSGSPVWDDEWVGGRGVFCMNS